MDNAEKVKAGGFRVWSGDFEPSEEMRKVAAWRV